MLKSIILVLLLLVGLTYATFFLDWNRETRVLVVTFGFGSAPWWVEGVPIGLLPIIGAVIGAMVMAVAAWVPWATQRRAAKTAEAKLQKAVAKFAEQREILGSRNEEIEELQAQLDELESLAAPDETQELVATEEIIDEPVPADVGDEEGV